MRTTKDVIAKNFSRFAREYTQYAKVQKYVGKKLVQAIPEKKVGSILDIGCGVGHGIALLHNKFPQAKILVIDIAKDMIEVAKKANPTPLVSFIVDDIEHVELAEKFDLIFSNSTFQWLHDFEGTLKKCRDSLSPGGIITFSCFGPKTYIELQDCLKKLTGNDANLPVAHFMDSILLSKIVEKALPKAIIRQELISEEHTSLLALLKRIKYTGTRGRGLQPPRLWTQGFIKKLEKLYLEKYRTITATNQVFYIETKEK